MCIQTLFPPWCWSQRTQAYLSSVRTLTNCPSCPLFQQTDIAHGRKWSALFVLIMWKKQNIQDWVIPHLYFLFLLAFFSHSRTVPVLYQWSRVTAAPPPSTHPTTRSSPPLRPLMRWMSANLGSSREGSELKSCVLKNRNCLNHLVTFSSFLFLYSWLRIPYLWLLAHVGHFISLFY